MSPRLSRRQSVSGRRVVPEPEVPGRRVRLQHAGMSLGQLLQLRECLRHGLLGGIALPRRFAVQSVDARLRRIAARGHDVSCRAVRCRDVLRPGNARVPVGMLQYERLRQRSVLRHGDVHLPDAVDDGLLSVCDLPARKLLRRGRVRERLHRERRVRIRVALRFDHERLHRIAAELPHHWLPCGLVLRRPERDLSARLHERCRVRTWLELQHGHEPVPTRTAGLHYPDELSGRGELRSGGWLVQNGLQRLDAMPLGRGVRSGVEYLRRELQPFELR